MIVNDSMVGPFEKEYPEAADFIQAVLKAGGTIKVDSTDIKSLPRNTLCPCGSNRKVKKCHPSWMKERF